MTHIQGVIPISDIAYSPIGISEKRVEYYIDLYSKNTIIGLIFVRRVKGTLKDAVIEAGFQGDIPLTGGNKYIILDGRHRLIAKKRLGLDAVNCWIER